MALGTVLAPPAIAQEVTAIPVAQRIELPEAPMKELGLAARQRMLIARMAASHCLISAGVNPGENQQRYRRAQEEFATVHTALRDGDLSRDIKAEQNARVLSAWHHLDTAWEALQAAYRGSPSQEDVKDLHVSTTRHANDLVAEMRAAHARKMGPQGMQTALMVDLYQRQTMLSQSIIHQICRIYLQGEGDDSAQKALKETLPVFEGSLQAFISGLPSAGVAPPQDAALRGTLMDAARIWQDVAPLATQIANDNAVNRADVLTVLSRTETFLPYMVEAAELLRVPKERS